MLADLAHATHAVAGKTAVLDWLPVAALVTGVVTLAGMAWTRMNQRRDQRRTLYAESFKAALAWVEMLYRVRRRGPDQTYELAGQFHSLQEKIDFHQGWIAAESRALGRAYCRLVLVVKHLTFEPIKAAWKEAPCRPEDGFSLAEETHPPVARAKDQFIEDLRDHLSLNPVRRRTLRRRYSDEQWERVRDPLQQPEPTGGTP